MNTILFKNFEKIKSIIYQNFENDSCIKDYNIMFVIDDYMDSCANYDNDYDFLGYNFYSKNIYFKEKNEFKEYIKKDFISFLKDFLYFWLNTRTNWYWYITDYDDKMKIINNLIKTCK